MRIQERMRDISTGIKLIFGRRSSDSKSEYIDGINKVNEKNLKYDFLPSMLEIIDKPENKLSNTIIVLILALIVTAIIWAAIAKVDIVVTSMGNIMPEGNLITVVNAYGGEVGTINIKDGDKVEKNQIIATINSDSEIANLEEYEYELSILECQKEVYEDIRDYQAEGDDESIAEDTFGIDLDKYADNKQVAESIIAEQRLFLIRCQEYDIAGNSAANKESVDNQKAAFVAERNLTIMQNINSLNVKIKETKKNIEDTKRVIKDKEITASESGVISNLSINSSGQVLPSGQNICYIVPDNSDSMFVAYVKTSDIETIDVDDEVRIRISALSDTEYKIIQGRVKRIGDVAINAEGIGSAYKVEIVPEGVPKDMLKVGAEGTCDIIAGKRSVLMYFIEPFIDGLKDSLHER